MSNTNQDNAKENDFGFIILRHVNSKQTDYYWKESYKCIRKLYPNQKIIIIDDNSDYKLVSKFKTVNCEVVQSEYKARGELLPYFYYARNRWFSRAVIIHDSVFIKKKLPIMKIKNYLPFWHFVHKHMKFHSREKEMLMQLKNNEKILGFHEKKHKWMGIFGAQVMIEHDYIKMIDEKHDLSRLIPLTKSRYDRMCIERVMACILHKNDDPAYKEKQSWLGNHHRYARRYYYPDYIHSKYNPKLPMVKIRTGR